MTLRADAKNHFNGGLLPALQPTRSTERDDKKIAIKTSAALSAANIGYATRATLYEQGSPELMGLIRLGVKGLDSAAIVATNVASAVELVEQDVLKPLLRGIVMEVVPIAVLVDESTALPDGRRSWVEIHFYVSTMTEAMAFIRCLHSA